jgi:hypothetical protein
VGLSRAERGNPITTRIVKLEASVRSQMQSKESLQTDSHKGHGLRRLGWLVPVVMLLVFIGDRVINGQRGKNYHRQLMTEFSVITPLPNDSVTGTTDNFSVWNSHKALVGATYRTTAPYSDIERFYSRELESKGWYPVEDHSLTEWGKDYGGRQQTYCKGKLAASLEYAGESQHGWTYALDLPWGLHHCR